MEYMIKKGVEDTPIFILLHGTGGTEESLLDVGKVLNEDATLIGIRGNILEGGYPRYFKRLEEGIFDVEDLKNRTIELHEFIQTLVERHDLNSEKIVLIGYSNGANIGIKLFLDYPTSYQKGILFHPMYPVKITDTQDLSQTKIFITMGKMDPIVTIEQSKHVLQLFRERKAEITEEWTQGHQLTYPEILKAKEWLA
ncbi:alpha/beta hydrolase [Vagococcus fluvialis]|uniref:alpha/beta hydrolase n=1 Tax=Vagococcus fluvialis TaxID=2738 RepID=UPI001A8D4596|nr:alpha/beta hydrolase [Vagococcus fluvialis]MBO0442751.1 alpha/beta hydrolase [Vagococcus fluvialis]